MRKNKQDNPRSGSISVFLICLLSGMISVFFLMYGSASFRTLESIVLWNGENAGQSILSYYLPELKERYDLFGFWGETEILEHRMGVFVEESSPFWNDAMSEGLLKAECLDLNVSTEAYRMMDPVRIKIQMDAVMKYGALVELSRENQWIETMKEILTLAGEGLERKEASDNSSVQRSGENRSQTESGEEVEAKMAQLKETAVQKEQLGEEAMGQISLEDGCVLENEAVIRSLPSRKADTSGWKNSWALLREDPNNLGTVIRSSLSTDMYALHYFGSYVERQGGWFRCQLEYILQGELSDEENLKKTKRDLFFLRTLFNLAAISRDDILNQTIGVMAAAAAPIPYPVAFGILSAAYSAQEAGNDVKMLMNGEYVPVVKSAGQWSSLDIMSKTDAEGGTQGNAEKVPGFDTELSYENHLWILLMLRSQETKVLRMMDLIQLDLSRSFGQEFTLDELCCGFHWKLHTVLKNSLGKEKLWTCEGDSMYGTE